MKKTRIITAALGLCLTASMIAGCNNGGGSTGETGGAAVRIEGGQTQISVEASAGADTSAEGEYGILYNGYKIIPTMNAGDAIAVLGDDYDLIGDISCAGGGWDKTYQYQELGIVIFAHSETDAEKDYGIISVINITGNICDCGGFFVGDTPASAKNALGTPSEEDEFLGSLKYEGTNTVLEIFTDGTDKIVQVDIKKSNK